MDWFLYDRDLCHTRVNLMMNINVYIYVHYNIYITFTSMSSMSTCFNLRMMMPLSEFEETQFPLVVNENPD